jgi:hypothetical protein
MPYMLYTVAAAVPLTCCAHRCRRSLWLLLVSSSGRRKNSPANRVSTSFVELDVAVDQRVGHGIATGVKTDVAFAADASLVYLVDFGHVERQRRERGLLPDHRKGLVRMGSRRLQQLQSRGQGDRAA